MIHYLKSPGGRRYARVTGTEVTEVLSGEKFCQILICDNSMTASEILEDPVLKAITPLEFISFYDNAMKRLTTQRLDI